MWLVTPIAQAIGGRIIRAILGGPLPTQDELDAYIASHPMMQDR